MPPRRTRLNWIYDNDLQQFTTPTGRVVSLHEIAALLHDQVTCCHDFHGPWAGWKMRGDTLVPPRGSMRGARLKPHNAAAFARWVAGDDQRSEASSITPATRPQLRLVFTRGH